MSTLSRMPGALLSPRQKFLTGCDLFTRSFWTPLDTSTAFTTISDTAYFAYVGRMVDRVTIKYARCATTATPGSGAQTAEIGLFSTTQAPNCANQTLTKIVSTGTVDALTSGSVVRGNTSSFAQQVAAGTHLWVGIRTAMAVTQPTLFGVVRDFQRGYVLTTATAGALTSSSTFTGSVPAMSLSATGVYLWASLD